jgi:hypothetical protein
VIIFASAGRSALLISYGARTGRQIFRRIAGFPPCRSKVLSDEKVKLSMVEQKKIVQKNSPKLLATKPTGW